jgi:PAS domain S-box-containing protein
LAPTKSEPSGAPRQEPTRGAPSADARLTAPFEQAAIGFALATPDGRFVDANAAYCAITGYSLEELRALSFTELVHPDDLAANRARHEGLLRGEGSAFVVENRYLRKGGGAVWVRKSVSIVRDDAGAPFRMAVLVEDVTERRRTEQALRESERRYLAIHDRAPFAIALYRQPEGTLVEVNPAWERMFGYGRDEALGRTTVELGLATDEASRARMYAEIRRHGFVRDWEMEYATRSGERRRAAFSFDLLEIGGQQFHLGTALDVTERRRAEEALRRYELLASLSRDIVLFMRRDDGRILEANAAALAAYGYGREELTSLSIRDLRAPDTLGLTAAQMAEADEHGLLFETVHRRKDGTTFHAEVSSRGATVDGTRVLLSVIRDVSARKRAEQAAQAAHDRLVDEDRRKTEFLGVLSHELRNPLAPLRNSSWLLDRAPPDSQQAARARDVIRRQTDHLARLVDDLLDVTRISRGKIALQRTRVDLGDVARRTAEDLRPVLEQADLELRLEVAAAPAWIDGDPTRLAQVVGNLLHNAVKFTPQGGAVSVSLSVGDGGAELRVRDTGVGMERETLDRLFQPFVQADRTLARTGGGLGLGLALVRGLVELHGGTVSARSDGAGRGSEVVVRLPLAPEPAPEPPARRAAPGRTPRVVLVIEDQLDAGQSLAEILELEGHRVGLARDGQSGVALARELRPDVVLCDIGLPDVDGYEVARTLRLEASLGHTCLVALSGYAQPDDRRRAREAGFDVHLAKPADLADLLAVIARGARPPDA